MKRVPAAAPALALGRALTACAGGPAPPAPAPASEPAPIEAPLVVPVDPDRLIGSGGIGRARAGMTVGALRSALAPDMALGAPQPFMVDLDAMPVVAAADTLFWVLFPSGEPPADGAEMELLAATHPSVRTPEGIGPGSTLGQAAAAYGPPTLSFNVNDESREYARFPGHPSESVLFRTMGPSDTSAQAGVYTTQGEHNETTVFDPAGTVLMVLVSLR